MGGQNCLSIPIFLRFVDKRNISLVKTRRKGMIDINPGKRFENSFKASVPNYMFFHRIADPPQSFGQDSSKLRFSPKNPFDCFLFTSGTLMCLELKSIENGGLTFWREDFEGKSFNIKKHQIEGLKKASLVKGVIAGFVINFRKTNNTYFLHINDFITMTTNLTKKSINENDVASNGGLIIESEIKKVNYKYNIQKFVHDVQQKYN